MSAQDARSLLLRRAGSGSAATRLAGSAPDRSGALLTEVVATERAVKRGLVPVVREALAQGLTLVCEIMPGVGEYVLGNQRELTELVGCAAAEGVAAARGGEVCVRVARQRSGFAPTDTVLVSVSVHRDDAIVDVVCLEASLPLAAGEEAEVASPLAGKRVLVLVPTVHGARVQRSVIEQLGAVVESVADTAHAAARLRAAKSAGTPFDVVYVDDGAGDVTVLLRAARDDASLGAPSRVVATVLESASALWLAVGAQVTITKPVLPSELRDALLEVRRDHMPTVRVGPSAVDVAVPSSERRPSGVRRLHLAELLASVAVAPTRESR